MVTCPSCWTASFSWTRPTGVGSPRLLPRSSPHRECPHSFLTTGTPTRSEVVLHLHGENSSAFLNQCFFGTRNCPVCWLCSNILLLFSSSKHYLNLKRVKISAKWWEQWKERKCFILNITFIVGLSRNQNEISFISAVCQTVPLYVMLSVRTHWKVLKSTCLMMEIHS